MSSSNNPRPVPSILDTIGNTPVLKLQRVLPKDCADVFVKLETVNPTGSYKDRMAKSMIEEAMRRGDLKPHMTVVEATGGSTGSSLALICAVKNIKFMAMTSDAFANEKLRTMAAFGGELDITHSPTGKTTPEIFATMKARAAELGQTDAYFYTEQFSNSDALVGYAQIGHELVDQFPDGFDAFCGAFGTGGMVMGVSSVLRSKIPNARIFLLEPDEAALLTKGMKGAHSVEGIAPGFISDHVDKNLYDDAFSIKETEACEMCRRLAKEEGLMVGTSSGLNIVAALRLAKELGPGKKVVTVACDTGLKYLNGSLFEESKP